MTYTAVAVRVIKINVTCFHLSFCIFVFNFDVRLASPHSGGYGHRFNLGTTTDNRYILIRKSLFEPQAQISSNFKF